MRNKIVFCTLCLIFGAAMTAGAAAVGAIPGALAWLAIGLQAVFWGRVMLSGPREKCPRERLAGNHSGAEVEAILASVSDGSTWPHSKAYTQGTKTYSPAELEAIRQDVIKLAGNLPETYSPTVKEFERIIEHATNARAK